MRLSIILAGVFCAMLSVSGAQAEAVYWNYGIASVQTGWSKRWQAPVGYKISFVGLGPDGASPKLAGCIERATIHAGEFTWQPLDRHIHDATQVAEARAKAGQPVDAASLRQAFAEETQKTGLMIAQAEQIYRSSVAACMRDMTSAQSVQLGIVSRLCVTWAPAGEPCKRARDPVGRQRSPATGRYAKIYDWLQANGALRPLNDIVQLVPNGGKVADVRPDLMDRAYLQAPTPQEAQRQFEDGAERLRRLGIRYDYIAPRVAAIDKSVAVSLIDTVDHPAFVLPVLKDEKKILLSASNELVRTRIKECVLYQGQGDLTQIQACSGATLDDQTLKACLAGGRCAPDLREEAWRAALAYGDAASAKALAGASQLPRILGTSTVAAYQAQARECAKTSADTVAFNYCLMKSQVSGRAAETVNCLEAKGHDGAASCVAAGLGDTSDARAAKCFLFVGDARAKALCLAAEKSPAALAAYECYEKAEGTAAAAICLTEANLPPQARDAVGCATQNPDSYAAMGACLAGQNLSGDAAKLANCAASSGGNAIGAAACLAGPSLTPEQQILLQCATQSADASSFAVCTGGRLALKEFQQCRDNSFGEDDCFGENNEIRAFSRRLGLGDIHKDTVVGQIADAHLQVLKSSVSVAEGVVAGVGQFVAGAGEAVGNLAEAVGDAVQTLADGGKRAAEELGCFLTNCDGRFKFGSLSVDVPVARLSDFKLAKAKIEAEAPAARIVDAPEVRVEGVGEIARGAPEAGLPPAVAVLSGQIDQARPRFTTMSRTSIGTYGDSGADAAALFMDGQRVAQPIGLPAITPEGLARIGLGKARN